MAKVTYRGITYDTETRVKEQKTQELEKLVYRGIPVKGGKEDVSCLRNHACKRSFFGTHLR